MAFPVAGSPVEAFADGVRTVLTADATLVALVTGIYAHVPEASRTAYPYLVIGRRSRTNDAGAFQTAGNVVAVQIDGWSDAKGPHVMHTILSRVAVLLERQAVTVTGFELIGGSLTCELEDVFDESDGDQPEARLYHGLQRWVAEVHG